MWAAVAEMIVVFVRAALEAQEQGSAAEAMIEAQARAAAQTLKMTAAAVKSAHDARTSETLAELDRKRIALDALKPPDQSSK